MKHKRPIISLLIILSMISFCNHIKAATDDSIAIPKFGLGAQLFNLGDFVSGIRYEPFESIYMTFNIGKKFRLEPIIGFAIGNGGRGNRTFSGGIGVFLRKPVSQFNMLYGLRVGYNTEQIKLLAPTVGGEYYFFKRMSIAAEVQLRWLHYDGEGVVLTNSSAILRFYFK